MLLLLFLKIEKKYLICILYNTKINVFFFFLNRQKWCREASRGNTYSRKSTENLFIYFVIINQDNELDLEFLGVDMVNCQYH